jgi:hypothetical protein
MTQTTAVQKLKALVPNPGVRGVRKEIHVFVAAAQELGFIDISNTGGITSLVMSTRLLQIVRGVRSYFSGSRNRVASYTYAMYAYKDELATALANLPTGAISTQPSLTGECAVKLTPRLYQRYAFDGPGGNVWQPVGIAAKLKKANGKWYWEHGIDLAACQAELAYKVACELKSAELNAACKAERETVARAAMRTERRARLIARLCDNVRVTVADVRAAGACRAGIEAWARHHAIDLTLVTSIPLTILAKDSQARYYALRVARTVRSTR